MVISTGPGHLIDVTAGERGLERAPATQQALCDDATRIADAVMTTLAPRLIVAG